MKRIALLLVFSCLVFSCKKSEVKKVADVSKTTEVSTSKVEVIPVSHATAVIKFGSEVIYLDPTGGKKAFESHPAPTYVFITDVHGDHMNIKTLSELDVQNTVIVAPKAVSDNLKAISAKEIVVINNGETKDMTSFSLEAIPMYNLREEALRFHQKGRGNGYVLTVDGERLYFSGDTEDIPEMRSLKNIDRAYICMNLPYTMTVESAASAVLDFKPKQVYPYHYRGGGGLSDVAKFKSIVNKGDASIEVVQLNWYPNRK
jgi:L-ascorbate metabolism protein UlaG (beta-lactamase superfamily)